MNGQTTTEDRRHVVAGATTVEGYRRKFAVISDTLMKHPAWQHVVEAQPLVSAMRVIFGDLSIDLSLDPDWGQLRRAYQVFEDMPLGLQYLLEAGGPPPLRPGDLRKIETHQVELVHAYMPDLADGGTLAVEIIFRDGEDMKLRATDNWTGEAPACALELPAGATWLDALQAAEEIKMFIRDNWPEIADFSMEKAGPKRPAASAGDKGNLKAATAVA